MHIFYCALIVLVSISSSSLFATIDDLLIKNNTNKTVGIIWFIGDKFDEQSLANAGAPAILAPKDTQLPSSEAYFPNTDTKSLKKTALQSILGSSKEVTGALFFDTNNPEEQLLVKFYAVKTGTVKRDGKEYDLNEITLIAPPEYKVTGWQAVAGFNIAPDQYEKMKAVSLSKWKFKV